MGKIDFKPIGERVLVKKPEKVKEEKTSSGIIIPETVDRSRELETISTIIAVGDGIKEDSPLREGVKIKFENPHLLTHKGEEYYLIHERNVLLILGDDH